MGALSVNEARQIAESLFSGIEWNSESEGFMPCPGSARHTKSNAATDCRIMLEGGKPPTVHCLHASCGDEITSANFRLRSALGKAESQEGWRPPEKTWTPAGEPQAKRERPRYDREKLERFAGEWAKVVDLAWLANRSVLEPSRVSSHDFLSSLYRSDHGEKVVVFTKEFSQGQALWPDDSLPKTGKNGVWFLAQPVDGEYRPNPRRRKDEEPKMSRRSQESVRDFRFMVLESDEAPARLWLGALAQLPLRISAIYTSGGRSVHVLVRVDARTSDEWNEEKTALLHGLLILGADPGSLSNVRLTRLPGCWREGKTKKGAPGAPDIYTRFTPAKLQKLLYVNPAPLVQPILEITPRRDVVVDLKRDGDAMIANIAKVDIDGLRAYLERAEYYAPVSEYCRQMIEELGPVVEVKEAA